MMPADSHSLRFGICLCCLFLSGCGGSQLESVGGGTTTGSSYFSCPSGQSDVLQYFVMSRQNRDSQFMSGQPNPIYTEVFPDEDFATGGYWFWLKSSKAHGFDVKSFDQSYVYIRSTELTWTDNTTFKRFDHDLPIAPRCVASGAGGPSTQVADTSFQYFSSCMPFKSGRLGTSTSHLDPPIAMDTGGNVGPVETRVLHYQYNCDSSYQNCGDEEQFFLGKGYGLWQWNHYQKGVLIKSSEMNDIVPGRPTGTLPCPQSYE